MSGSRFESPEEDLALHPVGDSLRHLLHRRGLDAALELADVQAAWEQAVGPELAGRARPVALRSGSLVVEVDDGAWATQLRVLSGRLLAQLSAALDRPGPVGLEVRVGRPNPR